MNWLKWLQLLGIALACLVVKAGEQPVVSTRAAYGRSAPTASGETVSLSVQPLIDKTTTRLRIKWSGQEPDSILVVSFEAFVSDPLEYMDFLFETTVLDSGFLLRKIDACGEATVTLDNKTAIETYAGSRFLVSVRVVDKISLSVECSTAEQNVHFHPPTHMLLKGEGAPSEFRFPCSRAASVRMSRRYPEHEAFLVKDAPDEAAVCAVVKDLDLSADIRLLVQLPEN